MILAILHHLHGIPITAEKDSRLLLLRIGIVTVTVGAGYIDLRHGLLFTLPSVSAISLLHIAATYGRLTWSRYSVLAASYKFHMDIISTK